MRLAASRCSAGSTASRYGSPPRSGVGSEEDRDGLHVGGAHFRRGHRASAAANADGGTGSRTPSMQSANSVRCGRPPAPFHRKTVAARAMAALRHGREGRRMGRTRWAVAAFVVASLLWVPSSILAFQPGKVRWPIKTSIPEGADLDHPTRVDLADLIDATKLPDAPGVTKNDAQFQAARIPKFDNPLGIAEGDILSTVGWLHLVAAEADGDYHIQVSPTHDDDQGTDFLIVEVPTPETDFVADTSWHAPLEGRAESDPGADVAGPRTLNARIGPDSSRVCRSRGATVLRRRACRGSAPRQAGHEGGDAVGTPSRDAHRVQSRLHAVT